MFRKLFVILAVFCLIYTIGFAEMTISAETLVRPGKSQSFAFISPEDGEVNIRILKQGGDIVSTLQRALHVKKGNNYFLWNGYSENGNPIPEGNYTLLISMGDALLAQFPFIAGDISPVIMSLQISSAKLRSDEDWYIHVEANMKGTIIASINIDGEMQVVADMLAEIGQNTLYWDGKFNGVSLSAGMHMLSVSLIDDTGFSSSPHYIAVNIKNTPMPLPQTTDNIPQNTDEVIYTVEATDGTDTVSPTDEITAPVTIVEVKKPVKTYKPPTLDEVPPEEIGSSFWKLPAGDMNENAIWQVMIQPITIVKGVGKRAQIEMYRLRAKPDTSMDNENILGEITCESQGVHVLKTLDNGWSYVEVYNSSYGPNCKARRGWGNSDELIRGYVETNRLASITPRTDYGLLIDKLTQRLYVFKEGKLFSELLISTGKPTSKQPWNETPSGEFLMVSKTGGFWAGNLYCDMAMRINGGCLIHEVPYILNEATDYHDYSSQEPLLGSKASHGCVRVQRKKNDEGLNMQWLWNNIGTNTKVLVWDDMPGRFHEYPPDDMMIYYNPQGGKYYHADKRCSSIKSRYLPLSGSFTYAELDNAENQKFTPCNYCDPPMRKSEIDELNRQNGF